MPHQLPADCLDKIFEFLEDDKVILHSCLLVNCLWCEVSVRILWKNVLGSGYTITTYAAKQILNTLIVCLPSESKDLLHNQGGFISNATSEPSLFNYATFCKDLSVEKITKMVENFLDICHKDLVIPISSMLIKQFSLKKLTWYKSHYPNMMFIDFPGDCLTELSCSSDIHPEFFYQLSKICHNILSLHIEFTFEISNGLTKLISSQNSLKCLSLKQCTPSLSSNFKAITKLQVTNYGLSFITKLTKLQELVLSLREYNELQRITVPRLRILKIHNKCPNIEALTKFIENNGRNLKVLVIQDTSMSKTLSTRIKHDKIETLKAIFNSCQQLESFEVWFDRIYLIEKEILKIVAKYSPENFHELKLHINAKSKLVSKDLESFFIDWKNRISQNPLSITIIAKGSCGYDDWYQNMENLKIIEKYKKLGIIKQFECK